MVPGAVDLQLIALLIDLHECKIAEHRVEHLGQTEALLAADDEAGDGLALEHRLRAFAARGVRGREYRHLVNEERRRRLHRQLVLEAIAAAGRLRIAVRRRLQRVPGSVQALGRAVLVFFQHGLQVRSHLHSAAFYLPPGLVVLPFRRRHPC